jgi:hypothetical protein
MVLQRRNGAVLQEWFLNAPPFILQWSSDPTGRPVVSRGGDAAGRNWAQLPGRSVRFNALAPQHYKVVTFFLATMPSQTR